MEAWLAELEMERDSAMTDRIIMEAASFDEQIAAALGEDFPYPTLSSESNTSSPGPFENFDYTNFIDAGAFGTSDGDPPHEGALQKSAPQLQDDHSQPLDQDEGGNKRQQQQGGNGNGNGNGNGSSKKRKREPSQVLDHIMAERKRRELLAQRFIALSAIVPGLKKTDKTSVLGEAIKYLKQLQEKVKVLEEVAAKRTMQSVVVVKKSQLVVDDDDDDEDDDGDGSSSYTVDENDHLPSNSLPEIEVKVSDEILLFRIYCEKRKASLGKLFAEFDKHDDVITLSSSVIPFGTLACITIVVQRERGFDNHMKDLVRSLRSALQIATQE